MQALQQDRASFTRRLRHVLLFRTTFRVRRTDLAQGVAFVRRRDLLRASVAGAAALATPALAQSTRSKLLRFVPIRIYPGSIHWSASPMSRDSMPSWYSTRSMGRTTTSTFIHRCWLGTRLKMTD